MSEVDVTGQVLSTFTDVKWPYHLSTDSEDHVFVADCLNGRILLLKSELQLERVLVDKNSHVKRPSRLHYNELTSQLHVVHKNCSSEWCSSGSSDDDDDDDDDDDYSNSSCHISIFSL